MLHSYPKEWFHKTSYSGPKVKSFNNKSKKIWKKICIAICHLHNKVFVSANFGAKTIGPKLADNRNFRPNYFEPKFAVIMQVAYGDENLLYKFSFLLLYFGL